jgi:autotransporter-associated beta strand protein
MEMHLPTKGLLRAIAVLGATVFISATASATTYILSVNELNNPPGGDWYQAIWTPVGRSGLVVATPGNDYVVGDLFNVGNTNQGVRTVNWITNQPFPGNLILTNAGVLFLKGSVGPSGDGWQSANIILDGGQIDFKGTGGLFPTAIGGTLQVSLNPNTVGFSSSFGGGNFGNILSDQTGANARDIMLYSDVSGNGNVVVNLSQTSTRLVLLGTNTAFNGTWVDNWGIVELGNGCVNPLGLTASITLNHPLNTYLKFDCTNDLVINNPVNGVGNVWKANTNQVTLNFTSTNAYTGSTIISNGVLALGSAGVVSNSANLIFTGGTLDASSSGGLVLNPDNFQQLTGNGSSTLLGNLTASSANTFSFDLTQPNVLNITGTLTLNGVVILNLILPGFLAPGTYPLMTYSGTIQGGGSFNLVPPAGSGQFFTLDTATPGQINVIVTGNLLNLTWVGDNVINSWDTSTANWTGGAAVYVEGNAVTFDDSGSTVPTIDVGSPSLFPAAMTVNTSAKQYVFDGEGIACRGTLTKQGSTELDLLSGANNFSGPIIIQSGTLSLGNGGVSGSLGTGPITNNGTLQVNMLANAVALNAPISGSGSLVITGGGAIATIGGNGHNSYTGPTTIGDQCQLNIATSNALGSASSGTTVLANGRLGVVSYVGSMTVPEPLTINGTGIAGAAGALYCNVLGDTVTWSGPVTVASASQVRALNSCRMNFANTVTGNNIALTASSGNPATPTDVTSIIDFQNNLSLGSSGSLVANGNGIVMISGAANVLSSVSVTAPRATLLVNGVLSASTTLSLSTSNTLGGSGTILGTVTVPASFTLTPGNLSIGTLTINSSVVLNGTSTAVMELNRTNAQNADKLSATSVAYGGKLIVQNLGTALQGGDTFQLFSGSISGTFASITLPTLPSPNMSWDTSLLNSSGIIKVTAILPNPVRLINVAMVGTNLTMQTDSSQTGYSYYLQATPALSSPAWTDIQSKAGTGGSLSYTSTITPGNPRMLFRIREQ